MTVAGSNVTLLNSTAGRTLTTTVGVTVNSGSLTLNAAQPIAVTANNNSSFNNNVSILSGSDFSGTNVSIGTTQNGTTLVDGAGSTLNASGGVSIGQGIAKTGTLTLQNGASTVTGGTTMATFQSGTGILNILSNADYSTSGLTMSNNAIASQNSSATISGAGSTLSNAGAMSIGSSGSNSATMTISNSAAVSSSGTGFLTVGSSGFIDIQSGGTFTIASQAVFVSSGSGSQGKIRVGGTGSSFTQTGNVGVSLGSASGNIATIQTTSGGSFSTGTAGMSINATGLLDIVGGTFNLNGNMTIDGGVGGILQRGSAGTFNIASGRTVTVQNGGEVVINGNYSISPSATITVNGTGSSFDQSGSGTLTVGQGSQLNIIGSAAVTALDEVIGGAGNGTVTQSGGTHVIQGTTSVNSGGTITVAGGSLSAASIIDNGTFNQTGGTVNVTTVGVGNDGTISGGAGTGNATISGGTLNVTNLLIGTTGGSGGTGTFTRNPGATVNVALTRIGTKGRLVATPDVGATWYTTTLSIDAGGVMDLNNNDLVVNNGVFSTIQALVFQGYSAGPDSTKTGIISTTGQTVHSGTTILALFDNSLAGFSDYPNGSGHTISAGAIVGKYTYIGDTNMDGQVTPQDYTATDSNLGTSAPLGISWFYGDTNFDGNIDPTDYAGIDGALGLGVGNPLAVNGLAGDFDELSRVVPEPGVVWGIGVGMLAIRRRRMVGKR
jgi:fibronectin-binding autotransporter adhesin